MTLAYELLISEGHRIRVQPCDQVAIKRTELEGEVYLLPSGWAHWQVVRDSQRQAMDMSKPRLTISQLLMVARTDHSEVDASTSGLCASSSCIRLTPLVCIPY